MDLLSVKEVCLIAQVTKTAVIEWERHGKISSVRVGANHGPHGGRMRLFSKSEVLRFIAARAKKRRRASTKRKNKAKEGK